MTQFTKGVFKTKSGHKVVIGKVKADANREWFLSGAVENPHTKVLALCCWRIDGKCCYPRPDIDLDLDPESKN